MSSISVENVENGILLKSESEIDKNKNYLAKTTGKGVVVVHEQDVIPSAGSLDSLSFQNFLDSLILRRWTGRVIVSLEESIKQIYFSNGRLVFAGSNQMDDRLGEVIYRRGMISLDEMMDAAVLVTKEAKFGQVCLEKGTFTNEDLWLALRAQIMSVVKSIFMSDVVSFSMEPNVKAPTEVALWESTRNIFSQCAASGAMYRYFSQKLNSNTEVRVSQSWKARKKIGEGTFVADLCQLCDEKLKYGEIESASKLLAENTKSELLELYVEGAIALSGESDIPLVKNSSHLSKLKGLIEGYDMVVSTVQKVYSSVGKDLPFDVCKKVISKIDSQICPSMNIKEDLSLSRDSLELIFSQCVESESRTKVMEENIRGLIQFVVLAAGDSLPYEQAGEIKKFYKTMIQ
jgi:hypothetical protein